MRIPICPDQKVYFIGAYYDMIIAQKGAVGLS